MTRYTTLFLDVGGVLLTNGWDHHLRKRAADHFQLNYGDLEKRHKEIYDLHETDQMSLDEYLSHVVFWTKRDFSLHEFKSFLKDETRPYPEMIEFVSSLKQNFGIKIAIVSNEGRELTEYRIKAFHLDGFVDYFFVSCYVHYQKPSSEIYWIALDIAHVEPEEVLYIDDRPYLVEAAEKLGIRGIIHTDFESTKKAVLALLA